MTTLNPIRSVSPRPIEVKEGTRDNHRGFWALCTRDRREEKQTLCSRGVLSLPRRKRWRKQLRDMEDPRTHYNPTTVSSPTPLLITTTQRTREASQYQHVHACDKCHSNEEIGWGHGEVLVPLPVQLWLIGSVIFHSRPQFLCL